MPRVKMLRTLFFCGVMLLIFATKAVSWDPSEAANVVIKHEHDKMEERMKKQFPEDDNTRPESEKYECPSSSSGAKAPCYKNLPSQLNVYEFIKPSETWMTQSLFFAGLLVFEHISSTKVSS